MKKARGLTILTQGRWQYLYRSEAEPFATRLLDSTENIFRARTCLRLPVVAIRNYEVGEFLKQQSKDHYSGTMAEVVEKIRRRTGVEIGYHVVPKSREHLLKYQPKQEDLPARSMQDSYSTVTLPLSGDEVIQQRYINHRGRVRMGRLVEDMDMIAVWLCHRHVLLPDLPKDEFLPYTFVTLQVDRVDFFNIRDLQVNKDIELSGFVSWVGRSSMEITIYFRQLLDGAYLNVTKAVFLMVARNATNTGAAPVNPIEPANDFEQSIWEKAALRQKNRKSAMSKSVFTSPPLEHEQAIMYKVLKQTTARNSFQLNKRMLPPKCRWMADSKGTTMMNSFPENRNAHNSIFGGFIMRQAVELGFIIASIYTRRAPILKCISDISFLKPVKVTAILQMTAYVVYTSQNFMQLMVVAKDWHPSSDENTTTNVFYLTYEVNKIVDEVLPGTYREMIWYIHGRRKFNTALNLNVNFPTSVKPDTEKETKASAK